MYSWTVDELLVLWPVIAIAGIPAIWILWKDLRHRISRRRNAASGIVLDHPVRVEISAPYSRVEWLRDMADPDLTVEEITVRVVASGGSWRRPPDPPVVPPPKSADPSPPTLGSIFGNALVGGGLGALVGLCVAPPIGQALFPEKRE